MDSSTPSFAHESSFATSSSSAASDLDSFFDETFLQPSPSLARSSFSSASPTTTKAEYPAPSYPYEQHTQQIPLSTGLSFNDANLLGDLSLMQLDGAATDVPPFFFPETASTTGQEMASSTPAVISPMLTTKPEPAAPAAPSSANPGRKIYYPGVHQELFRQQQAAQQKPRDPVDAKIDAIFESLRPVNAPTPRSSGGTLPQIAKLKKDEEEMDEDERLLVSEEGKKLSSKERRQLRNKVSARAFRSRRKEYINQLESEVAKKSTEAQHLAIENDRLKLENKNLQDLVRTLFKHPNFSDVLNEMVPVVPAPASQSVSASSSDPLPAFNPNKNANPNQQQNEWALDYGNIQNWINPSPTVFRVEVPEPSAELFDPKMAVDEDDFCPVADGFFPTIRNEKGDVDFSLLEDEREEAYQPPEMLEDVFVEIAQNEEKKEAQQKKSLDELFPGMRVPQFLERLESVVGGEKKVEDVFDVTPQETRQEDVVKNDTRGEEIASTCAREGRSNRMLKEAEGCYRRIGLMVQ